MELAGIVISGVGLVALESTVEDIFQKVATWRHHGVDYEHLSLQLEIAHLAYQRWQKTVKLVEPSTAAGQFNLPIAEPREAETVGRLLGAISAAFQDAEKTSKRYETEDDRDDSPMEVDEKKSPLEILTGKVRAANKARQSGTGVLQKARWMVHDKKALETLVERVASNVAQLVNLFPATIGKVQEKLATLDIMDMVPADEANEAHERQQLVQLFDAAKRVDPIMQVSANESIKNVDQRHTFKNVQARGKARILTGDEVAEGFSGPRPSGTGHSYDGIEGSDESRIQCGDRFGGRSFWDD